MILISYTESDNFKVHKMMEMCIRTAVQNLHHLQILKFCNHSIP